MPGQRSDGDGAARGAVPLGTEADGSEGGHDLVPMAAVVSEEPSKPP